MPTTVPFDTLNHDAWTGDLTAVVLDNDNTPNRVLDITKEWHIKVRWSLTSEDTLSPLTMITQGHWRVEAFAESIGTATNGFEGQLPLGPLGYVDVLWGAGGSASYKAWDPAPYSIPGGIINVPGIYKVTVMIQYHMSDNTFTPMVGFAEYPLICFNRLP